LTLPITPSAACRAQQAERHAALTLAASPCRPSTAWDLKTGKLAWVHKFRTFNLGLLLTTGDNLAFAGGPNDSNFRAFDASSGKVLWETATPLGVTVVPTLVEVDGEQCVAVQAGWDVDAQRMQAGIDNLSGKVSGVPQGGTVMVCKLASEAAVSA